MNGERIGYTTSSGYGHTLGACVAFGYLTSDDEVNKEFIDSGEFVIEQADRRYKARASLKPLYDPASARARS